MDNDDLKVHCHKCNAPVEWAEKDPDADAEDITVECACGHVVRIKVIRRIMCL